MTEHLSILSRPAYSPERVVPECLEVVYQIDAATCRRVLEFEPETGIGDDGGRFVLVTELNDDERAVLWAHLETGDRGFALIPAIHARWFASDGRSMRHIDVRDENNAPLLLISIDEDGRESYVYSDVPSRLGLPAGAWSRPQIRFVPHRSSAEVA